MDNISIYLLLDYSLRCARSLDQSLPVKWEESLKLLFENTLKKGIIDGYILMGWYFQQFYFLDREWTIRQVQLNYELEQQEWQAFIGGFAFSNPPFNKEIYGLFYPHYKRAVEGNFEFKNLYDHGIIRHLVAFYFWGFENLDGEGLLLLFIQRERPSEVLELVNFVWRQEDYLKELSEEEAEKFEKMIFNLWSYLAAKYADTTNEEEMKILDALPGLLVFASKLNAAYTDLVLRSIKTQMKDHHSTYLFENLIQLKGKGEASETAKYIGQILNAPSYSEHYYGIDEEQTTDLIIFLFENGQKNLADEICERLVKIGNEFLIEIRNRYKNM